MSNAFEISDEKLKSLNKSFNVSIGMSKISTPESSSLKDTVVANWNNTNSQVADFYTTAAKNIALTWDWSSFASEIVSGSLNWDNFKVSADFTSSAWQIDNSTVLLGSADLIESTMATLDKYLSTDLMAGYNYGVAVANYTLDTVDTTMSKIDDLLKASSTVAGYWISGIGGDTWFSKAVGNWLTGALDSVGFGNSSWYTTGSYNLAMSKDLDESEFPAISTDAGSVSQRLKKGELPEFEGHSSFSSKNPAIKTLLKLTKELPDEFSNMFDVYFVLTPKTAKFQNGAAFKSDTLPLSSIEGGLKENEANFQKLLSSRIESITIPGRSIGTFEQKVMGTSVIKPTTKIEMKGTSSFTIQADSALYWIHLFNKAAQVDFSNYETWKDNVTQDSLKSNGELPFTPILLDYTIDIFVVANHFEETYTSKTSGDLVAARKELLETRKSSISTSGLVTGQNIRESDYMNITGRVSRLNKQIALTGSGNESNFTQAAENQQLETLSSRARWVFEDCRFLGPGTPISFKKDSAEPLKFSYDFTFKRLTLI